MPTGQCQIALAFARVLRPDTTLFVDVGRGEYFLGHGSRRAWFGLPDEFLRYANRVQSEDSREELTIKMRFPPWALPTERWPRKQAGP
jgi:hypothetical protein